MTDRICRAVSVCPHLSVRDMTRLLKSCPQRTIRICREANVDPQLLGRKYRVRKSRTADINPEKKLWKVCGSFENRWFTSLPALVSFYRNWHIIPMKGNSDGDLFPFLEDQRNNG
uniref:Transposase n=1 Tax=Ditylenchus dipsaci TaxID=166011 RepID=A0A915DCV4_9BILA